ncbi:LLM class flavin-dependent oxidoreductase [Rhizobium leguminosarum]|uniref:LLM class flavin-dependent oxidoreductase n=1 Tax=Rhizobium leguminosarum TaxID=384 RepID=UPI003D7C2DD9
MEPGISSASAFLAAATQRTSRIELGTAVIPIGYESPYRLAEEIPGSRCRWRTQALSKPRSSPYCSC